LNNKPLMQKKHIYSFNYDRHENDLCKLESRYIFNEEEQNKLLFSDLKIEPSHSAFIKKRLDIIISSTNFVDLITQIKNKNIYKEGFKVEYLILPNDTTGYKERLEKIREIGHSIEGEAQYTNPTLLFGLSFYNNTWYFGELINNNFDWHKHKQKPHSFSNSISSTIAKSLVNIAKKDNPKATLIDTCCGVGTILLEACFSNSKIDGCDINEKICRLAYENLDYYNYSAPIIHSDIKDVTNTYDTAIIDLPYNLFTKVSNDTNLHIIESASKIANQLIIVSTTNITNLIQTIGFKLTDHCSVKKRGKGNFSREIWVCERDD